jgi:hypothetical protein
MKEQAAECDTQFEKLQKNITLQAAGFQSSDPALFYHFHS